MHVLEFRHTVANDILSLSNELVDVSGS